jgi:hypothetical protein
MAMGVFRTANLDHMLSREKLTAPAETEGAVENAVKTNGSSACSPGCGGAALR